MPELSVVIITFNEERNIARCLESVKEIADDIVVVDSFSTDKTEEICKNHGVRFFQKAWTDYSEQKNYADSLAKHDWIFSIDADESLSDELKKNILDAKKISANLNYRICRMTNYCGKWIKHCGWYPDVKLRFFDRRQNRWEGRIHEKLIIADESSVPILKGDCYHYSYYTLEGHKAQAKHFSEVAALDLFNKGKNAGFLKPLISAILKFIKIYLIQLGFLDGKEGFIIARISANAVYLKYSKLRQLYR